MIEHYWGDVVAFSMKTREKTVIDFIHVSCGGCEMVNQTDQIREMESFSEII